MTEQVPSEGFAIGEHTFCVSRYGRGTVHCVIVGGLAMREMDLLGNRDMGYMIEVPGIKSNCPSGYWNAYAWQLIKKRPPKEHDETCRWDECPWQPESIHV